METIYLYKGALLQENGECALPIPRLFTSLSDARAWARQEGFTIRIVLGVRTGDRLENKVNRDRREREQVMRDMRLTKVRGNLGGTYWE